VFSYRELTNNVNNMDAVLECIMKCRQKPVKRCSEGEAVSSPRLHCCD
jgi:hypothetical protein